MKCLSDGELQSLADCQAANELDQRAHLLDCLNCRERWERLQQRRSRILRAISLLDPALLPDMPNHFQTLGRIPRRRSWKFKPAMVLIAGLSLVVIIATGFFIHMKRSTSDGILSPYSSVIEVRGENQRLLVTLPVDLGQYRMIAEPQMFIFKEENHEPKKN